MSTRFELFVQKLLAALSTLALAADPKPIKMIVINMQITKRMSEDSRCQLAFLRHHDHQQSIAGNVERHTQCQIC